VTGTATPAENRGIGRNTLLLQVINSGAGARKAAESFDAVASRAAGSTDEGLNRVLDETRRSQPQERSGVRQA